MKNLVIIAAVIVLAWLGYSVLYPRQNTGVKPAETTVAPAAIAPAATVTYVNNAFSPASLSVAVGSTVQFVNGGTSNIRIPSGPHPVHTSFPEFDSDTLAPGESYSFTFTNPMTLKYHNHYNPDAKGQVVVE